MTMKKKSELISRMVALLDELIEVDPEAIETEKTSSNEPMEMLTVKECSKAISGLSEHTVRQLVAQEKLPYVRAGTGKNGKILISKSALLKYFNGY